MTAVHDETVSELIEWFEDVVGYGNAQGVGGQCLILPTQVGWGRTTVLSRLLKHVGGNPDSAAISVMLSGADAPDGLELQASWLPLALRGAVADDAVRRSLGIDSPHGVFNRSLGLLDAIGLFGGRAGSIAAFLFSLGFDAFVGRDVAEAARKLAEVERLALRVARFSSRQVPVVLAVDDAELLDLQLLDRLVTNLVEPIRSRVLVVVACAQDHPTYELLLRAGRLGLAGDRIHRLHLDGSMDADHRFRLIQELAPEWPIAAAERLADRTDVFAEIYRVMAARGAADVRGSARPVELVDNLIDDAVLPHDVRSLPAAIVSWAGGVLHARAFTALTERLALHLEHDPNDICRSGSLVRLSDPPSLLRLQMLANTALSSTDRDVMAAVLVETTAEAVATVDDPLERIGLLEPVSVLVDRDDVQADEVICHLLADLARIRFRVGDRSHARRLAERVATWSTADRRPVAPDLLQILDHTRSDLLLDLPADCIVGIEAYVRRTATLLRTTAHVEQALAHLEELTAQLDDLPASPTVYEWRLLLGHRLVASGHPTIATRLLAPILALEEGDSVRRNAELVMYATGHTGELQLQRAAFEERHRELSADSTLDQRVSVVDALCHISHRLGDRGAAVRYGQELLTIHRELFGPDHLQTLTTRANVAAYIGLSGEDQEALRLFTDLLPDITRVLGPDHPNTLKVRDNLALWTGRCGDPQGALRLYGLLLPDQARVLGADDTSVLNTRNNIAFWTGECGQGHEALQLLQAVLADRTRVLGADHPDVLTTRSNVATWTGWCAGAEAGLRGFQELLPDAIRVLGAEHPDVLTIRNNVAGWTGQKGDCREALRLSRELLPDRVRILGADHPDVLTTRSNIARWTAECGDRQEASRLYNDLLADRIRVLGAHHPHVHRTRSDIRRIEQDSRDIDRTL